MRKHSGVCSSRQQGFSLIEVLIAVAVLSFGLLAIGTFQAKLVKESAYSKARSEAIALAQEKIDDLRNYPTEHDLAGKLKNAPVSNPTPDQYLTLDDVATTLAEYPSTPTPIVGTNASFTRTWSIQRTGALAKAIVKVTWEDSNGDQEVKLETDLTYRNPRGTIDMAKSSEPLVDSPTGKAYLGDGTISDTDLPAVLSDPDTTNNNDGTYSADYDGDGDLELIIPQPDGTAKVALTLPDACKLDEGCTQFVQINGTVYLDRAAGGSSLDASDIFVLASDAAYCSRWIPTGIDEVNNKLITNTNLANYDNSWPAMAKSGGAIYRDNDTISDFTGAGNNNYDYFNYTCYIGGGWYGNIGLVMVGAQRQDFACVGDPLYNDENSTIEGWKKYELAKRRVYRGMIHKYTLDGSGNHVPVTDGGGKVIYYTRGIGDAVVLPDPAWTERSYGHDYVISNENNATSDDCVTVMTHPDARGATGTGNLFHNIAGDFICLNEDNVNDWTTGDWAKFDAAPWEYLNFDTSNTELMAHYDAGNSCPYNPSDPPSRVYSITGQIDLEEASTVNWGSANYTDLLDAFEGNVNTSAGVGDCTVTNDGLGSDPVTYNCKYYVWEDDAGNAVAWNGHVRVDTPRGVVCAPDPSPDTLDPANLDRVAKIYLTGLDGTTSPVANFACQNLNKFTIQGTVSVDAGNDLSAETLTIEADPMTPDTVADCVWDTQGVSDWTYTCTVQEVDYTSGYTGEVRIALPGDYSCTASSTAGTAAVSGNVATFSYNPLTYAAIDNDVVCDGPMEQYTIAGTVVDNTSPDTSNALSGLTVSIPGGNCTTQPNGVNVDYSCTVVVDTSVDSTWQGDVTVAPSVSSGVWCAADAYNSVMNVSTSTDTTLADVICDEGPKNIHFRGAVFVAKSEKITESTTTTTSYEEVGFGNGDHICDVEMNCYPYLGGDYRKIVTTTSETSTELLPLSAELISGGSNEGTCTFDSIPTSGAADNQWYEYSCTSDSRINRNQTWSGSINIYAASTPSGTETTTWMECSLGSYILSYSGVTSGNIVDNAFSVMELSDGSCTPYSGAGPWTAPDGTTTITLPWEPTYQ